jgi:acid phosphatase type 7
MRTAKRASRIALGATAMSVALLACSDQITIPAEAVMLVAAGDVSGCDWGSDDRTASLVDHLPGTVLALGDNAYEAGSRAEYDQCYAPNWGRFRARTRPVPGNHEYETPGAQGYFGYFGNTAGGGDAGYYSFDVGDWHLVALNTMADVTAASRQAEWLRADLARNHARCTLAFFHHPRFSSGEHGSHASMSALWNIMYDGGVDVALSGHDHMYERFAPQTADGSLDAVRGIRQFVVGTGGAPLYHFRHALPNSEVREDRTYGVLSLSLSPDHYDWRFEPTDTSIPGDAGSDRCH